jgi:hypothetical protein
LSAEKIERVVLLAERLIAALEADIAALERGKPREMKTIEPEIQRLSALYAREAAALTAAVTKAAPADARDRLAQTTARFRDVLARQLRILTRMRNTSEGMIHAIAKEVERRRTVVRPYGRTPVAKPRPTGAMLYNATA